jgi:neutral ceramidase
VIARERETKASRLKEVMIMAMRLIYLILIPGFFLSLSAQTNRPVHIQANTVRINLTPPLDLKFSLGGYGERMSKPAQGIHDSIWVKALVLDEGQKKYALVTMDILALPPNVKPQVLRELARDGWNSSNLMILPSHSHTSLDMSAINDKNNLNNPYIGIYQPELLDFVKKAVVSAVEQAARDLKPVVLGSGRQIVQGMNRNRRGDAEVDRDLTVTRIDLTNGKPLAILVNWTAHPTITGAEDMFVSAEWPGFLQTELEKMIDQGVNCLYFNGAEGDQSYVLQTKEMDHYRRAEIYGKNIATKAFATYQKIKTAGSVIFAYHALTCPLPAPQLHPGFASTGGEEYGIDEQNAGYIFAAMCPAEAEITALRLGDLLIVGAPGEMTYQLGSIIKKQLAAEGIPYPVIGVMANEWISYILSAEQYAKGGYETSVSFYGPQLGGAISKTMMETASVLID